MKELTLILFLILALFVLDRCAPYDDTDDVANQERSGLVLYTDHGTGCQYLGKMFGPPIPRLDANGNQICE